MPTPVRMPKLGWTMEEGTILQWYNKEGESITKGEPLLEVETDKVSIDVEAPVSGVLGAITVGPEETVAVETVIAVIANPDEPLDQPIETHEQPGPEHPAQAGQIPKQTSLPSGIPTAPSPATPRPLASPAARRLARKHGIDLTDVKGSRRGGVVSLEDVKHYLEEEKRAQPDTALPGKRIKLTRLRRTVGLRMQQSLQKAPHFAATVEVDMTEAERLRTVLSSDVEDQGGDLTLTVFLVKAVAKVLRAHPSLNALVDGDQVLVPDEVNIGVAVALEEGLIVPVVHRAHRKELAEIAASLGQLTDKTKLQKLSLEEVSKATFTISNLGMFGVDQFTAIINPPQTAILAVGRTVRKPFFVNGQVEGRLLMKMTLSADHRAVDGALVGAFLADLRKNLEEPELLEL